MLRVLFLSAVLCGWDLIREGETASCSYPDQWAAEGIAFQPVRYFINFPECQKSTIFVHYPSKSMQVRSFAKMNNGKFHETGLWVYRNGLEGSSVNIPLFSRQHIAYTEHDRKRGVCDVMTFRTGDNKPMTGAIEMHQHLTNLTPIKASDGSIKYYEKNFTSHQVLQISMKLNKEQVSKERISSGSNYLYSAFSHRVKINSKGQCIPLAFQRYVYFGASCVSSNGEMRPNNLVPQYVEYFYVANPATYQPGEIGKFDRSIPQLSCGNDFMKLNEAEKMVEKAFGDGTCVSASKLDYFINTCCKMTYAQYEKTPACDLTQVQLFKPYYNTKSRIRQEICDTRHLYETGTFSYRIFHRDANCKIDF